MLLFRIMTLLEYILNSSWGQKIRFLGLFFIIFTISYSVLFAFDWLPEAPMAEVDSAATLATSTPEVTEAVVTTIEPVVVVPVSELPREINIPALGRTVTISNTSSNDVPALDADLLKGAVRHPDSAKLGEEGNVFILAHSSYLPNVINKNFQAFNGIQKLVWGDTIIIKSDTQEYVYQVSKVYKAKASALTIPVAVAGRRLTLATCNSFGTVDDRHIVEAELVDTRPLSQ